MKYRPDIDGIRAIAVLLVLFYHAHFSVIASGFIGVDIFFVISGFLITNIILDEINATHTFKLVSFYKKRLWRLMPVLIALFFTTSLACYVFYLPADLIDFSKSLTSVARFQSNQFFSEIVGGYFSPNINYLPLLHTWSLSIEWQWYAILPVLLLGLNKLVKKKHIPSVIILLWLFFLFVAMRLSYLEPTRGYYFLSTRIFELLTGSVLVVLPLQLFHSCVLRKISKWMAITKAEQSLRVMLSFFGGGALCVLFFIALQPDVLIGFPNYFAVTVCIATAVLIAIGQIDNRNWISRLLALKFLVGIGLISYSLYIWHWPIFSIIRYLSIEETNGMTLMCLGLSFFLGFISWYWLERPARRFNQTNLLITLVIFILLPITTTYWLETRSIKTQGFPNRFAGIAMDYAVTQSSYYKMAREQCIQVPSMKDKAIFPDDYPACQLGSSFPSAKKVLMIGDSFANQYWGFMDVIGQDANLSIQSNTTAACLVLPDIYLANKAQGGRIYGECRENTQRYFNAIKNNRYDYVVLGQVWSHHLVEYDILNKLDDPKSKSLSIERMRLALDAAIVLIIESGARPVIIDETFSDNLNRDSLCFTKSIKMRWVARSTENCETLLVQSEEEKIMADIFNALLHKYPTLIFIDPKIAQCPAGECNATIEGIPIYIAGTHLNDFASYKIGDRYLKMKGNPFKEIKH